MASVQEANDTRRSAANPWLQSSRIYTSVGGLRDLLMVEKQFGLLEDLRRTTDASCDGQSDELPVTVTHSGRHSLDKINHLIQISKLKEEVKRLETKIILKKTKQETSDIMDLESVNMIIDMLQQKSSELGNIIEQKKVILKALQEDTTECLVLPIESQENLNQCVPILSKQLGDNLYHIDNIEWVAKFPKRTQELQNDFDLISWYTNHLKKYFNGISDVRELMIKRTKQHLQS